MIKKSNNKVISGVVASFAEHFKIDSFALRVIVFIVTMITGFFPMVFVYIVCIILMPASISEIKDVEISTDDNN